MTYPKRPIKEDKYPKASVISPFYISGWKFPVFFLPGAMKR